MIRSGAARVDITPGRPVYMDGMLREHRSVGVHDRLHARALVMANGAAAADSLVVVSVEVCGLRREDCLAMKQGITGRTGVPGDRVVIAATHTHSGPATVGFFNPQEKEYVRELTEKIIACAAEAFGQAGPARVGCGSGREETISHYRRLLSDDNRVIMNWEPFPPERIVRVLGEGDPELGVLKVVDGRDPARVIAVLFNHPGHPNVMSGDNYLLSADYPGRAAALLERRYDCVALFINGAQGSVDIDGLKDRDWPGVERAGAALAEAAADALEKTAPGENADFRAAATAYTIPARRITPGQLAWAEGILRETGGKIKPAADGVGDDFKAALYRKLHENSASPAEVEQVAFCVNDCAFVSFPGELFTEIGLAVRRESPFPRTYLLGLANGRVGYVPTRRAIAEGGYEVDTRRLDDSAEDIVREKTLALLTQLFKAGKGVGDGKTGD
jgi:hypothetical protein